MVTAKGLPSSRELAVCVDAALGVKKRCTNSSLSSIFRTTPVSGPHVQYAQKLQEKLLVHTSQAHFAHTLKTVYSVWALYDMLVVV